MSLVHGLAIIREPRAVGGAHLLQAGEPAADDVRDPERAPDLDQLAPRHDHFLVRGQRVEAEQDRGGVVVDHDPVLRSGHRPDQARQVRVARAALAALQVKLQVEIAGRLGQGRDRGLAQRRAAEVGVQDHAGGVDHPPQRGPADLIEARDDLFRH